MIPRIKSLEEYNDAYRKSVEHPENFWAEIAEGFTWKRKWDKVLSWDFIKPDIRWFEGGELNITENCLDRHLKDRGEKIALIWEPNDPSDEAKKLTYRELHAEVCRVAGMLRKTGVNKGDRVCIYLPMIPELLFSVLACARIGAIHSVVFAGFSSRSLAERINDAACSIVITSDGLKRGSKEICLKDIVDEALPECDVIKKVIVYRHTGCSVKIESQRDVWWHEAMPDSEPVMEAVSMQSESPLFILYTSGSTGKPKGVVHTTAGYMIFTAYTFQQVFQYDDQDVYWCTADIGWITGHSYIIYGPLLCGATTMMFEGVPTWPDAGRFWAAVDRHQVSIFYTAPTAIRALEAQGEDFVKPYNLKSLKTLGTVGEPINEEAWEWYHRVVGRERCPVVDTWWQTETGGIMISPLAGITPLKPGYATLPLPGVQPVLLDPSGNEIPESRAEGLLCFRFPWPSIIRTTYGDHERCRKNYFDAYKGYYFSGDGARREENGMYRITGRVDDVINVSGHRLGTAEIEEAINEHEDVVESAVVGFPHPIKGQGIYAFVICNHTPGNPDKLKEEVMSSVSRHIGAFARPEKIQIVDGLPKTRSGKIMRRILRKIAEGSLDDAGDTSTLLDPEVVDKIRRDARGK